MVGCTRGHAFNFFKFFFKFIDNSFKDFSKMKFIKTIEFLKKMSSVEYDNVFSKSVILKKKRKTKN